MYFCWVTLPVKDLDKSLHFYHEILGLPIEREQRSEQVSLVMLGETGKPLIELIQGMNRKPGSFSADITVGIAVDSLDETLKIVQNKGVKLSRGPISPNPHIRFAFVFDPDGYEVQLVETK